IRGAGLATSPRMIRTAAVVVLAITGSAAAQPAGVEDPPARAPERGFIAGGFLLGGDHFLNAAPVADGGIKVPSAPGWIHGLAASGSSFDFEGGGGMWRAAVGFEARTSGDVVNLFGGVDVGFQHQRWE